MKKSFIKYNLYRHIYLCLNFRFMCSMKLSNEKFNNNIPAFSEIFQFQINFFTGKHNQKCLKCFRNK